MKRRELKGMDTSALIAAYVVEATKQGQAIERGDHKQANRAADELIELYRQIRIRGPEAQEALLHLLVHREPSVRCWSATHALEFAPLKAERVLADLAPGKQSFVALTADVVLKQWRRGELTFP